MTRKILFLVLFLFSVSCGISRIRTEIPDFVVMPNGKGTFGLKTLNAFIFENSLTNIPFQQFVSTKFKTQNLYESEVYITLNNEKFKLLFYSMDEFEKYFGSQNFTALKQENDAEKYGNESKFIAISLVNNLNEDCLNEKSLYFDIAKNYLKNLKNEYVKP